MFFHFSIFPKNPIRITGLFGSLRRLSQYCCLSFLLLGGGFFSPLAAKDNWQSDTDTELWPSPLQIAVFEPLQLVSEDRSIIGLRLNIFYGSNRNMYGLDAGLMNLTGDVQAGLAVGLFNGTKTGIGAQAGIVNYSKHLYGFQAGVVNITDDPWGLQIGLFNLTEDSVVPMFGILLNVAEAAHSGQLGLGFNQANGSPFQIAGLMNNSEEKGGFFQLAGGINFADTAALQIAGLFNRGDSSLVQAALGSNTTEQGYMQVAGFWNAAGNIPVQLAAILNTGEDVGFQLAAGVNKSDTAPVQIGGLGNQADSSSFQFSTLANLSEDAGIQLALLANISNRSFWQFALFNHSLSPLLQTGAFNLKSQEALQADETVDASESTFGEGAAQNDDTPTYQIGLVNRAAGTRGLMIGILNDADHLDGSQLGLFNIARNSLFPFTIFYNSASASTGSHASGLFSTEASPVQIALYKPGQLFDKETSIYGLRLSLFYGHNKDVAGLDLGLVSRSSRFWGIGLGGVQLSEKTTTGLRAGLVDISRADYKGVSVAALATYTEGSFYGLSLGSAVYTERDVEGLQIGLLWNRGESFWLPQISAGVNQANSGVLQISGLLNHIKEHDKEQEESAPSKQESIVGPQFTLGGNISGRSNAGQIAGLFNWTEKNVRTAQVSLAFNTARFSPLQVSGFGNVARDESWVQIAGLFNMVTRDLRRAPLGRGRDPYMQAALFYNLAQDTYVQTAAFNWDTGRNYAQLGFVNVGFKAHFQVGIVNTAAGIEGFQFGLVNAFLSNKGAFAAQVGAINLSARSRALQLGAWNMTETQHGVSIGLFNYANELDGLQIGLLNVHLKGAVPIMIGINF